ncbi:GEVED domain-containing protein [Polaribacter sp.]|uniref:GEVED domain-containing protein n=1 Tax=Polaribacter sp. TaxID=1920175 RepID=UPI003F6B7306
MKSIVFFLKLFICLNFNNLKAQSYCTPININNNNNFNISNIKFADINNDSDNSANKYTYYNNVTTDVIKGNSYSSSITFEMSNYNEATVKVWIDFNNDGTFTTSEQVHTYTGSDASSRNGITENFQITIPNDVNVIATSTRMRVAIRRGATINPCDLEFQVGEVEDYNINIKPSPQPPTANCIGSLDVTLDSGGNAYITVNDINNNSTDDYDDPADLVLSLDKYAFDCNDISSPQTVTLTVTDSDGLTNSCTTTVNVSAYNGAFTAPTLPTITEFCSYDVETPIMNYQCGLQIVGTTTDNTTLTTAGTYQITWTFDNGSTTESSVQTINILAPSVLTNVTVSNIDETSAKISWNSSGTGPYIIRYRLNNTSDAWTETTSTIENKTINGLDDGLEYEVQIKTNADCASYTTSTVFTTTNVQYCETNVNINKSNNYYISNVDIGNINNSTPANDNVYRYFSSLSTNVVAGETFSGTITYSRQRNNTTALVVWIDFNNDGDFEDAGEEILNILNAGNNNTVFNIPLTNILVPETATLGKTRLRVGLKQNASPTSSCNFDFQNGEIEDYTIFIREPDNTVFESALITQLYHYNLADRWIEITNVNETETIPANTVALALYKDSSGDQTNVVPTASFLIESEVLPGESILIKKPTSTLASVFGTVIENTAITDFDGGDDILIVTKKTDFNAWKNRFDVVKNISNNTSLVRNDLITSFNSTYDSTEWISFIDDNLSTQTNPPQRHPHAPLISEVIDGNNNSNIRLGLHNFGNTTWESNAWSNGYPDRSRTVNINQDLSQFSIFNANNLEINNSSKLLITNNLLVITNNILINSSAQIRLAGTSQLIQTHTEAKKISGSGKLFVDQNSTVNSKYRYNYFSSPVSNTGLNYYSLENVLKDGTTPTSLTSTPKNIDFISGFDGNFNNSPAGPIQIAEYWIYTYDFNGSNYGYIQKFKSGSIQPGKGFLMKGPGRPQNYTFIGTPNDGEYSYNLSKGNISVLVGNPYPSAINSKKFIEDNLDAITGTLYFWEHSGEKNSEGTQGHNTSSYIGGYATRNISMGTSASAVSSNNSAQTIYQYTLEAESGFLGGNATKIKATNSVLLSSTIDTLTFKNVNLNKSVDSLKLVYKAQNASSIDLIINQQIIKTAQLDASEEFISLNIPIVVNTNDTLSIKLKENSPIYIDKIEFNYTFSYTEPKQYIPIGQGFFISTDSDGGTVSFNNSQREYVVEGDNSVLLKSDKRNKRKTSKNLEIEILKLGFNYINENSLGMHRQIGASFSANNSFDFDKGYDSEMFDIGKTDIYWKFDNDDRKYVICGVQEITDELQVPLELLIAKAGEVSIEIDEWKTENKNVYLFDKVEDVFYLLNSEKANLDLEKGLYENRFYITFNNSKILNTKDIVSEDIHIFLNRNQKIININSDNNILIKEANLYNILGQKINSWDFAKKTYKTILDVKNIKPSIYILQLKTNKGTISKKILIN